MAGTIGATISYALTQQSQYCQLSESQLRLNMEHHSHHNHNHGAFALPFTIGGFLYISLVGIVPEIVEETNTKISLLQLFAFFFGIIFIYLLVEIENYLPSYFD